MVDELLTVERRRQEDQVEATHSEREQHQNYCLEQMRELRRQAGGNQHQDHEVAEVRRVEALFRWVFRH